MVKNILWVYEQASDQEIVNGLAWYPWANHYANKIASKYKVKPELVCGVISALSPNNKWEKNTLDTETCIRAFQTGEEFKVSTYNSNKEKAIKILQGVDPNEVLKGEKTYSFYNNIKNPFDDKFVTIDFHAYNIATLSTDRRELKGKIYREISDAYREAASQIGLLPNQLQAITWTTWRTNKQTWMSVLNT